MVDLSRDDPDFAAMCNLLGFNVDGPVAPLNKSDAVTGFDAFTNFDAITGSDDLAPTSAQLSELPMPLRRCGQSDLKDIVDGMFLPTPSVSLGRFPTSRLMRQEEPKLTSDIDIGILDLDSVDAVRDNSFTRVGRKGDETEAIPGLLGTGKWRRLKGGITMDSGCSIDTVPTGHAPNVKMSPIPPERANRRINAANGTRIKEHGVKQVRFRTREGQKQNWTMLVTDVKKALKSVATTCDGDDRGECHVLFTKHGGTIINVSDLSKPYTVNKLGAIGGAGELTAFDRTGNTYGMEAWVCIDQGDKSSSSFVRPAVAP